MKKLTILLIILSVLVLSMTGCNLTNPMGDDNQQATDDLEEGKLVILVHTYISSIKEAATPLGMFSSNYSSFYGNSACVYFELDANLYGANDTYYSGGSLSGGINLTLDETINNGDSYVTKKSNLFLFSKIKPGTYHLKIEEGEDGVKFLRQDFSPSRKLFFNFIGFPQSLDLEIKSGETTTVNLYLYRFQFSHEE